MISALATVLIAASLLLSAWAGVLALLNRLPGQSLLLGLAGVEALLVAQAGLAAGRLLGGVRPPEPATFVGYLFFAIFILPLGMVWALTERSRWGTLVLVAAGLVLAVMVVRLQQLWVPVGG